MAKYWIELSEKYIASPLSFWVHAPVDSDIWREATKFDPPLPEQDSERGYKIFKIEYKGCIFSFSSLDEIEHCIDVLSPKAMKTIRELSLNSWVNGYQHMHWLTKWPGNAKSYKDRQEIIRLLNKVKLLKA